MTTPIRNKPHGAVDLRQPISTNPATLLVFLYDAQLRIEWLAEDMERIHQQVITLRSIIADPRTHAFVGETLTAALASTAEDLAILQRFDAITRDARENLERDYRALYPQGDAGIPLGGSTNPLPSEAVAQLLHTRTGMTTAQAADAINIPGERPVFTRPHSMPCVMRNTRLIRRYGSGVQECSLPRGEDPPLAGHGGPSDRTSNDSHSGASGFSGAMAADQDDPAGIRTYADAYAASWETQARLFATGLPVDKDTNRRRFIFKDGSYVTIQAHVPLRVRTDDSKFSEAMLVCSAGAMGGLVGGPAGAVAVGAAALTTVELSYPCDAAWQGYTIQYFQKNTVTTPWATRYFYGWKRSLNITSRVLTPIGMGPNGSSNFADYVGDFTWWKWQSGRSAKAKPLLERVDHRIEMETQRLIQMMAGATKAPAEATASASTEESGLSIGLHALAMRKRPAPPWAQGTTG